MKFTKKELVSMKTALSFIESNRADSKKFSLHDFYKSNSKYNWLWQTCDDAWSIDINQLLICSLDDCSAEQVSFLLEQSPKTEMQDDEDIFFNNTDPSRWYYFKPYFIKQLNILLVTSFVDFNAEDSGISRLSLEEKQDFLDFYKRNKDVFDDHPKKIKIKDQFIKEYLQNCSLML